MLYRERAAPNGASNIRSQQSYDMSRHGSSIFVDTFNSLSNTSKNTFDNAAVNTVYNFESHQTLVIARQRNSRKEEADALNNLGIVYYSSGQLEEAIDFHQQALVIYRAILDHSGEANALGGLGVVYSAMREYERAIEFHQQSLTIRVQIDDFDGVAFSLNSLGLAYKLLGQYEKAIDFYQQSLAIRQKVGDRQGEAISLSHLGNTYHLLDQYEKAIDFYMRSLAIRQEIGDRRGEAISLRHLGHVYESLAEYEQAIDFHQQSLKLQQDVGDSRGEAISLGGIGGVYHALGQYQEAIDFYQRSLTITQEIGDRQTEAYAFVNIGKAYYGLGRYKQAVDFFWRSLKIFQNISVRRGEANAWNSLGTAYHALGQYQQSIVFHSRSLKIAQEISNLQETASALGNIGKNYYVLERYTQAIDFHQQSLRIQRELLDRQGEAASLDNLGDVYRALGQYQLAIDFYQQSLDITQEISDRQGEAASLGNLGEAYYALNQYGQAIDFHQQALSIAREVDSRKVESLALTNLGKAFVGLDHPRLAIIFYKEAVNVHEAVRSDIRGLDSELQHTYIETVADVYRTLAALLLEQGRIPEAQQVLDLLKLEEIREFTRTTRATWTGSDLQYTKIEQPVVDAHGSLIALGQEIYACRQIRCGDLESLREQQRVLTDNYEKQVSQFEAAIASNDQEDDLFQSPDSLSDDAYKLLQANPDAVLIYPFVTDDKLWLLWAAAGGSVGSVPVTVSRGELSTVVQQFGAQLTDLDLSTEVQASSQQLYRWLIEPLETELQANNIRQLIFVNDRVTRYIPMAALYDGEQYLLERYTISTVIAPAITDTEATLAGIDESAALGLGLTQAVSGFNPLPAVAQELDAIIRSDDADPRGIYPGQVFLDDDFTLKALQANVEFRQILHIATHAEFAPSRPEDSFIVLGNGDRMRIQDIEVMQESLRDLHLVVLSACKTALGGTAGDGTEIAGISSYFLAANRAETVIASLWAVNDTSTSLLMQRFYEFLASGELTKAEALRQAQLSLLYDEDTETRLAATRATISVESRDGTPLATNGFQHPYHWAPFILIGNGL
ncbi:hypothetical protein Lepto7375DRAFT_1417 [Leptolyngbya sp. PCC 7375]|nr:hypothetical protein Lepto7375DRAFT_1417 [Leptolyngbya sp. PCC 7375]